LVAEVAPQQSEDKRLANEKRRYGAVPVSDLVSGIIDPALRRKTGISVELVHGWEEIVGEKLAASTRPEKINWPPRGANPDDFRPGTLVLACDQSVALHIQHSTDGIVSRVNAFFGYAAIDRVKIVQKPVGHVDERKRPKRVILSEKDRSHIASVTSSIEDEGLRKALEKLGESIVGERSS
jgi:hypothetical protein